MIGNLGRKYTFILDPLVIFLKKLGVSPNTLSVIGLIMCIASGFCFGIGNFICASLSLIVAGLLDVLDGKLARMSRVKSQESRVKSQELGVSSRPPTPDPRPQTLDSNFGAFLDSSLDRYGDSFVFCGIIYHYIGKSDILVVVSLFALVGSYLTSYTKARAEKWIEMQPSIGILERPERIALLIIGGLVRMDIVLWLLAILSNITAIQRIIWTKKSLGYSKMQKSK